MSVWRVRLASLAAEEEGRAWRGLVLKARSRTGWGALGDVADPSSRLLHEAYRQHGHPRCKWTFVGRPEGISEPPTVSRRVGATVAQHDTVGVGVGGHTRRARLPNVYVFMLCAGRCHVARPRIASR
eukprot:1916996-Prymnesium_polylepis.2